MKFVEMIGHLDELHQLHVYPIDDLPPGPVRVVVAPFTEQDAEEDWRQIIHSIMARDWNTPGDEGYCTEAGKEGPQA